MEKDLDRCLNKEIHNKYTYERKNSKDELGTVVHSGDRGKQISLSLRPGLYRERETVSKSQKINE